MLALLVAALLQEEKPPSDDSRIPLAVSLFASYFEAHQASAGDGWGVTGLLQVPVAAEACLDVAGRWYADDVRGNDFDLGVVSLGASLVGYGHGGWKPFRFSCGAGLAGLLSNDFDDAVELGGYVAFQCDMGFPHERIRATLRYELIVPEADAGIAGKEFGLIQAFSLGLTLAF